MRFRARENVMHKLALFAVVFLSLVAQWVAGDCRGIPFTPKVAIFEPNQPAVIAFNRQEALTKGDITDFGGLGNTGRALST
jgi:hypothetical protein